MANPTSQAHGSWPARPSAKQTGPQREGRRDERGRAGRSGCAARHPRGHGRAEQEGVRRDQRGRAGRRAAPRAAGVGGRISEERQRDDPADVGQQDGQDDQPGALHSYGRGRAHRAHCVPSSSSAAIRTSSTPHHSAYERETTLSPPQVHQVPDAVAEPAGRQHVAGDLGGDGQADQGQPAEEDQPAELDEHLGPDGSGGTARSRRRHWPARGSRPSGRPSTAAGGGTAGRPRRPGPASWRPGAGGRRRPRRGPAAGAGPGRPGPGRCPRRRAPGRWPEPRASGGAGSCRSGSRWCAGER